MTYTATQLARAQEGSRRANKAGAATQQATRARLKAEQSARLAQCGAELERVATALYGAGVPIPATDGGLLFREVSAQLGRWGYEVTEQQLSVMACKRKLWRDSSRSVIEAVRPATRGEEWG